MGLFKKLFRFVENSSDIPTINDATNQFLVDKENKQLIIDCDGERITLGDISSLLTQITSIQNELRLYYRLSDGILIENGTDLDTITVPGNYYCAANVHAQTLLHCPTTHAFTMKVERATGTSYSAQLIRVYDNGHTFRRYYVGATSTWTKWNCENLLYNEITLGNITFNEYGYYSVQLPANGTDKYQFGYICSFDKTKESRGMTISGCNRTFWIMGTPNGTVTGVVIRLFYEAEIQ